MSGLFEHIAAADDSAIIAQRKAAAVATKRVKDNFGAFVANAGSPQERVARLGLVTDEIRQVIAEVVAEYGGDAHKIETAIHQAMGPMGPMGPMGQPGQPGQMPMGTPPGAPAGAAPAGGAGTTTCPECGGQTVNGHCPTCQGGAYGGAAGAPGGAYGLTHSIPQTPSTGPVQASHEAKGGFCDECHSWKSGPNKKCTCDGDGASTDEADDTGEDTHEPDFGREASRVAQHPFELELAARELSLDTEPITYAKPLPDEPRKEGVSDIDGELAQAPSAVGTGTLSATKEAEALKTVKLPTGDESALGGPSPKIDKGKSGDENGWTLDPIKTEGDGSPNPTRQQDPTAKADFTKSDFLDQARAVTKSETLPTSTNFDDAGFNTERNIEQYPTSTFPKGDQANPVTRETLAAIDPDKNPIRELMEEYDGFLMPNQVESAVRDWDVG